MGYGCDQSVLPVSFHLVGTFKEQWRADRKTVQGHVLFRPRVPTPADTDTHGCHQAKVLVVAPEQLTLYSFLPPQPNLGHGQVAPAVWNTGLCWHVMAAGHLPAACIRPGILRKARVESRDSFRKNMRRARLLADFSTVLRGTLKKNSMYCHDPQCLGGAVVLLFPTLPLRAVMQPRAQ